MKKITVNLTTARKLKKAGFPQHNTYFEWHHAMDMKKGFVWRLETGGKEVCFAAPTANEILNLLPNEITAPNGKTYWWKIWKCPRMPGKYWCIKYGKTEEWELVTSGKTLEEAVAKMWLYLKKENLL